MKFLKALGIIILLAGLIWLVYTLLSVPKTASASPIVLGTSAIASTTASSISLSSFSVAGGANSMLVVLGTARQQTVTNVTVGGVAMTKVNQSCTSFNECSAIYISLTPIATTTTVTLTASGSTWISIVALNLTNVSQSLFPIHAESNGNNSSPSVSITPASDNNLILAVLEGGAAITNTQTTLLNASNQSFENAATSYFQQGAQASKAMAATMTSGQRWAYAAVALAPDDTGRIIVGGKGTVILDGGGSVIVQ